MDAPVSENIKNIKQALPYNLFMVFLQKGEVTYKGKKYVKKGSKNLTKSKK